MIDVIVRFHSITRLPHLERAVFSVVAQLYRPITVTIVLQRFDEQGVQKVELCMDRIRRLADDLHVVVLNWDGREPPDARSELLNYGLANTNGRYVAFLDYDDAIYPEAYSLLVDRLNEIGAAIAFAGIEINHNNVYADFEYTARKERPFAGESLIDLLDHNFCPIHSFVIDRNKIPGRHLYFDGLMSRNEDYDFLIRICSQYESDFALVKTYIGSYAVKDDGSNTILTASATTPETLALWQGAEHFLEGRRMVTPVSTVVQRALRVRPIRPGLTVRGLLTLFGR